MLALVGDYLSKTMPKLPNFFATRTTVQYDETPELDERGKYLNFRPLRLGDGEKVAVFYRHGDEVVDAANKKSKASRRLVETRGTFGPLLDYVSKALAAPDGMKWSRWERGMDGPRAVFHWDVPERVSAFRVGGCCLPDGEGTTAYQKRVGLFRGDCDRSGKRGDPAAGAEIGLAIDLSTNYDSTGTGGHHD